MKGGKEIITLNVDHSYGISLSREGAGVKTTKESCLSAFTVRVRVSLFSFNSLLWL